MGLNKRIITHEKLISISQKGIETLISYITAPDCLIVDLSDGSKEIVDIIQSNKDSEKIKSELKRIGFYEFI